MPPSPMTSPRNAASAREGALSGHTIAAAGDTRRIRRATDDPPQVLATSYVVFGRVRPRAVLVVECPDCGRLHAHVGRVPFQSGQRTGACGARYVVHVGAREGRVVA